MVATNYVKYKHFAKLHFCAMFRYFLAIILYVILYKTFRKAPRCEIRLEKF